MILQSFEFCENATYFVIASNHVFNKHTMFIIIDKLRDTTKQKGILRQRLIAKENF